MEAALFHRRKEGKLFVVSAPAGSGKTTLVKKILENYPDFFAQSISYTTRAKREGEEDGKDYFFISKERFLEKQKQGAFLETNEIFGNYYGTDEAQIKNLTIKGKNVILVIDIHGAKELKQRFGACSIFISPPSHDELEKRLGARGSECSNSMKVRLDRAHEEMGEASKFDYHMINDDLEIAYQVLLSILVAENHKT